MERALGKADLDAAATAALAGGLLAILLVAGGALLGALWSEHFGGLAPCPLCLRQRWPYYVGLPLAGLGLIAAAAGSRRIALAALIALVPVFLIGAGLGAHHAGVEYGWWAGPTDCAGAGAMVGGNLLDAMNQTVVVDCAKAAWRDPVLGLSLAGWNVLVSLGAAAMAAGAIARAGRT
jgi:disulfide bond formation protein DsbB